MLLYLSALLLLLGWLTVEHFPPWISWHAEVPVFTAVALLTARGLWLVWRDSGGAARLAFPSIGWGLLGLLVLIVVQALLGHIQFAGDALVLGLYVGLCLAAGVLGFSSLPREGVVTGTAPQPEPLQLLASTLLIGALLSCVVAWVQVLDVWEGNAWIARLPTLRRPGGNLAQPNQLATLILMGLTSLIYLLEKKKLGHLVAGLMFGLMASGLALTESRTALLSLLALLGWWFVGRRRVGFGLRLGLVLPATAILLLAFWFWPVIMSAMELSAPGGRVNTGGGARLVVWPQLWEAVLLRPWTGWGLGDVTTAHNAVAHAYSTGALFTYSHNILLDMALGMGLPLTLLALVGVGYWLWTRLPAVHTLNAWYGLAAAIPLAVHSMLELPFAYAYFLAPVMFFLGRVDAELGQSPEWRIKLRWIAAVSLVALAVAAATVLEYIRVEEDYRVIRFESMRMGSTPAEYERPQVHLLTQMDLLLRGARIVPAPNMAASDLELLGKVALRHPGTATLHRYAMALALNGNPEEAVRQMRVIRVVMGEKIYDAIKAKWEELALSTYPQLNQLKLP
ncbi:MAG: Wzy polymerase domain-containing protein [Hylemonella sp.]